MKKLLCFMLSLCLIFSLSACKNDKGEDKTQNNPATNSSSQPADNGAATGALAELRQELSTANQVCGVLYVGGFVTFEDCKKYCEEFYYDDYPFLAEIKDENFVEASDGKEFFVIVPTDNKASVLINRWVSDDGMNTFYKGEKLYESVSGGEAVIVKCNFSDIFSDVRITVIDSNNASVEFSPQTSMKGGTFGLEIDTENKNWIYDIEKNDETGLLYSINDNVNIKDVNGNILLSAGAFDTVEASFIDDNPCVLIVLTESGKEQFAVITAEHIGQTINLCVGDEVISSPTVSSAITDGKCVISASTVEEIVEIINKLRK